MANIEYKDLKLQRSTEIVTFNWGDNIIEVNKYLPIDTVYDIVMITLQEAYENGIYNPIKLDMYFHLNLIYSFTNIIIPEDIRANEPKLYDELVSTGFLNEFLKCIDEDAYREVLNYIDLVVKARNEYDKSVASILKKFIDDLPANSEAAQAIVDNFDKEKYQAVVDFAKAANGNREI